MLFIAPDKFNAGTDSDIDMLDNMIILLIK